MVETNQFGSAQPGSAQVCVRCEALLMDVLDGAATAEDQSFFDQHVTSCTGCSRMLADARRGGAWLEMLREPRPEPPAALLERILAQTSGLAGGVIGPVESAPVDGLGLAAARADGLSLVSGMQASGRGYSRAGASGVSRVNGSGNVLPFRMRAALESFGHTMLQPRLAMTAAMAFFSIALTLNLTGVRVSELRASDLRPSNLRRGFYEANAKVVRYCDNLRVVYELEARAHDLQRGSDGDVQGSQANPRGDGEGKDSPGYEKNPSGEKPGSTKAAPKAGPGTSRREPLTRSERMVAAVPVVEGKSFAYAMQMKGDMA